MSLLSVHPKLNPAEHIPGYLVRLAKENGFSRVDELFYQGELTALMTGKGKKFEIVSTKFEVQLPTRVLPHPILAKLVRICPACVIENGFVKARWHSNDVYHCERHNSALIDTCEQCNNTLVWDVPLLQGLCPNTHCAAQLPLNPSVMNASEHSLAYECFLAGNWCLNIASSPQNASSSIKLILEVGYAFLSAPVTTLRYLSDYQLLIGNSPLPQSIKKRELYSLRKRLSSRWHSLNLIDEFLKAQLPYESSFISKVNLTVFEFCDITGVGRDTVEKLIYVGLIARPANRSRITPDLQINIAPIFSALSARSIYLDDAQSISAFRNLIEQYFQSNSGVLMACLEGKLPFQYQPGETLFDSLLVSEVSIRHYLVDSLNSVRDRAIHLEEIERLTGLTASALKHAIKSGLLKGEAQERFDFNQSLFLSEARSLLKINVQQQELALWES